MVTQFPEDFQCPISLEIMSDPVILSSGHTFDRSSIQRWLNSGHRTCPITKLPLPEHPSLIRNHALRSLISSYCTLLCVQPSQPISSSPPPPPTPPPSQAHTLISTLTSSSSSLDSKLELLSQLAKRTKLDAGLRRQLTESGAMSAVLSCVNSPDSALQEKALSLLLNLSLEDDNKVGLVAEGAIGRVVAVLQVGSPDSRAIGCTILTSLAVVEVNKATIGEYPFAIQSLVTILNNGKGREVKEAATALYAICSFPGNRRRVVEAGAVPILVKLTGAGMERAVEVLSVLVKCKEGREEIGKVYGSVGALVNVVRRGRERGVQCAVFTLNALCCCSEELCREAKREGVLEMCVGLMDYENEKIRRNALNLVQILSKSCCP